MISKKQCVVCQKGFFVGEVGEVLDHLCEKHKKEYIKERAGEIKDYLKYEKTKSI